MKIDFVGGERELPPGLVERRLLTEVHHLINAMDEHGVIDPNALLGVSENLFTKTMEDAMPGAVPVVIQPIAEIVDESGEKRRTFIWKGLGHTASQVAQSGERFHLHNAAFRRVAIEKQEARRVEEALQPGTTQVFVSPKMSKTDAPRWQALQEHLADEDSVRTSKAIIDEAGTITGRKLESLLVRDISLSAWIAMFRDPHNLWGKAFEIEDENSALSAMALFDQLDLPDISLPEGPVTLVAAVINYIEDSQDRLSVEEQLAEFRSDQHRYQAEARTTAAEWLDFEVALALSLKEHRANLEIRCFIIGLQNEWNDEMLALLETHTLPNGHYVVSETLAAKLEEAKQKLLARGAKVMIEAPDAIAGLGQIKAARLKREIEEIRLMKSLNYNPAEIQSRQTAVMHSIARANIKTGGGCSGVNSFEFNQKPKKTTEEKLMAKLFGLELEGVEEGDEDNDEEGIGKKKIAICRIEGCPSRPSKTTVGGCEVCLKYCQPIFEAGEDPAIVYGMTAKNTEKVRQAA